jgi:hypothetical protein
MLAFGNIVGRALDTVFAVCSAIVRSLRFVQPAGLNPATGIILTSEVVSTVNGLVNPARLPQWEWIETDTGDDRVLVRAAELAGVVPGPGHYVLDATSAERFDVLSARQDPTGNFWLLSVQRSLKEDWGDLTAATVSADYGDFTAASSFEDRGSLAV